MGCLVDNKGARFVTVLPTLLTYWCLSAAVILRQPVENMNKNKATRPSD